MNRISHFLLFHKSYWYDCILSRHNESKQLYPYHYSLFNYPLRHKLDNLLHHYHCIPDNFQNRRMFCKQLHDFYPMYDIQPLHLHHTLDNKNHPFHGIYNIFLYHDIPYMVFVLNNYNIHNHSHDTNNTLQYPYHCNCYNHRNHHKSNNQLFLYHNNCHILKFHHHHNRDKSYIVYHGK